MNKILIVSCGTIGSVLACRLSNSNEITVYDKDNDRVNIVKRSGIKLSDKKKHYRLNITNNTSDIKNQKFDLIIFATKCYDVLTSTKQIADCCFSPRVLYIQNGIIDMDAIQNNFPYSVMYRGVMTMAAHRIKRGEIKVSRQGVMYIGSAKASHKELLFMKERFITAGFRTIVVKNPATVVWAKLIFSSVMNPFPVLVQSEYNIIQNSVESYVLIKKAIEEGKKVAKKLGIRLYFDPINVVEDIRVGRYKNFHHKGSMYYDFVEHKKTENDYITGKLVKEAKRLKIKVPTLDAIYRLMKILEDKSIKNGEKRLT